MKTANHGRLLWFGEHSLCNDLATLTGSPTYAWRLSATVGGVHSGSLASSQTGILWEHGLASIVIHLSLEGMARLQRFGTDCCRTQIDLVE